MRFEPIRIYLSDLRRPRPYMYVFMRKRILFCSFTSSIHTQTLIQCFRKSPFSPKTETFENAALSCGRAKTETFENGVDLKTYVWTWSLNYRMYSGCTQATKYPEIENVSWKMHGKARGLQLLLIPTERRPHSCCDCQLSGVSSHCLFLPITIQTFLSRL